MWSLITFVVALGPSLVLGAIFPPDTLVKMLDAKGFKRVMKANRTSVVAFVAPWCGHCQNMAPEYSRAAIGLHPLVHLYAVDCDAQKQLCTEQGVNGFPTVKLFPRGNQLPSVDFNGERKANSFYYWIAGKVPQKSQNIYNFEDISGWSVKNADKSRTLLLTKDKKVPLLWQVLANKYGDQLVFASHHDRKGKSSVKLGYQAGGEKQAKVLVYPSGSNDPVLYEGPNKLEPLSKFFKSVLDGTANLEITTEDAPQRTQTPVAAGDDQVILQPSTEPGNTKTPNEPDSGVSTQIPASMTIAAPSSSTSGTDTTDQHISTAASSFSSSESASSKDEPLATEHPMDEL